MPERERPQSQPPEQSWQAFTALLPEVDHRRLLIALGTGLQEACLASTVATENGSVTEARAHVPWPSPT